VTGGCGFIGSNFIRYVLYEHLDWTVINLDKLTYAGNLASLTDIEANYGLTSNSLPITRYYFIKGDICDRKLVDSLFSGKYFSSQDPSPNTQDLEVDACVNFAAESHVDRSILDASPFIETNIKGTQVLLDSARAHWDCGSDSPLSTVDCRRFIQISTDEVYGALGETGKFTEQSALLPNNPYAASKAAAELLCRAHHKTYNLPIVITRSSNNYGPYQFPEKLIPLMIRNALNGKPLPVYGEGKQVRDWLYVEDNCRAIDVVLQKGKPGQVYNIGGSCEKRNIDVVHLICSILQRKLDQSPRLPTRDSRLDELIEFIADPRGVAHDFRYALDCSKMKEELGWKPGSGLGEWLEQTIEWYLKNQNWVENVITGEYQEYYHKVYGDD
jgi:dTDP-glucose 4,6-dehydratase